MRIALMKLDLKTSKMTRNFQNCDIFFIKNGVIFLCHLHSLYLHLLCLAKIQHVQNMSFYPFNLTILDAFILINRGGNSVPLMEVTLLNLEREITMTFCMCAHFDSDGFQSVFLFTIVVFGHFCLDIMLNLIMTLMCCKANTIYYIERDFFI